MSCAYFISLLDRFPGLAEGAYYLVAWIGLKLTISGVSDGFVGFYGEKVHPFHMPDSIFWTGMLVIVILSFLIKPKHSSQESTEATDNLDLLEEPETIANGTSAEDDRGRAKGGSDGRPSSSGPGPDQLDAPPDNHVIAAEHTPEESR